MNPTFGASAAAPTPPGAPVAKPLVHVEGLKTYFRTFNGLVKAVDDVTFDIFPGEVLAIVGESGSGKSVCVRSLMGLNSSRNAEIAGRADFDGTDLLALKQEEWKQIRGRRIGMIFQEPMSQLRPVVHRGRAGGGGVLGPTLGERFGPPRRVGVSSRCFAVLRIPEAERRFDDYPHQLSGGMLQRIMIAVVLALDPEVLIADEPTTALDVTIQAQILRIMRDLQERTGTSIVFITHDLGVVSQIADRVIVMYAGKIVEAADVHTLLARSATSVHQGAPPFPGETGVQGFRVAVHSRCGAATLRVFPPDVVSTRAASLPLTAAALRSRRSLRSRPGGNRCHPTAGMLRRRGLFRRAQRPPLGTELHRNRARLPKKAAPPPRRMWNGRASWNT